MQAAQGSLTILNPHTAEPVVFWNGIRVIDVQRVHIHHDEDESRVKLVIAAGQSVAAEMVAAGIHVKEVV